MYRRPKNVGHACTVLVQQLYTNHILRLDWTGKAES